MTKATAHIEMDNGDQHEITVIAHTEHQSSMIARDRLNETLQRASSFLVADDGTVIIVSRIHKIHVTEE